MLSTNYGWRQLVSWACADTYLVLVFVLFLFVLALLVLGLGVVRRLLYHVECDNNRRVNASNDMLSEVYLLSRKVA